MPIKILNLELTDQINELFDTHLDRPVELLYFSNKTSCDTCDETDQLLEEIASLSTKLHIRKFDVDEDYTAAQRYNVSLTPGLVVAGIKDGEPVDYGIRFAGIPSGYEFGSLIQAILIVSQADSGLKPAIRAQLSELKKPVQLRIFVTPT